MSIYSDIKSVQKNSSQNDYLDANVNRKLSAPFSVVFVKLGFSANFVTLLSLVSDLVAIYMMYLSNWISAGILVYLASVLDCSDGEVARYHRAKQESPPEKHFGGYLDEVLGTIGFTLVIFFAGYFMGFPWIGFFAMFGMFMVLISSMTAQIEFPEKKKIAREFEQKLFGSLKGRIGFSYVAQRMMVALAVIFAVPLLLFIFGVLANLFWIFKFLVYRNQ